MVLKKILADIYKKLISDKKETFERSHSAEKRKRWVSLGFLIIQMVAENQMTKEGTLLDINIVH